MATWETSVGATDDWYTPKYIFDALGVRFDLDVAAPADGPRHVPAAAWHSSSSLERDWGGFVWMNAPFGGRNGLAPWLRKFFEHGNGIALTPDRTSAPWWQDAAWRARSMLLINGKVKFERPDGTLGAQPGTGTTLFAAGAAAHSALLRAERADLGIVLERGV